MATTPQSVTDKKSALQKQIAELQEKMRLIDSEAIHELKLKLSDARKVVTDLEAELTKLTGIPGDTAAAKPRARRQRRPSISDDILKDQMLKMMAKNGAEGMNAKQIAERMNLDPIRIRTFIKGNDKVLKRQGKGPGTKFFLP